MYLWTKLSEEAEKAEHSMAWHDISWHGME